MESRIGPKCYRVSAETTRALFAFSAEGAKDYSPECSASETPGDSHHEILQPLARGDGNLRRGRDNKRADSAWRGGRQSGVSEQDRPPLFGTWRKAYAFAIALFAIEVALLYAFTLRFS
jgi:hypothetical protein